MKHADRNNEPGHTTPLEIPPDIAAKCTGPGQFEKFDRLFRSVIAVPKSDIVKAEAKWKRDRAKEARQSAKSR